jgi:hypothetical protein
MRVAAVRHVPEPELHAYLDQALSRSQCIEIETHLAACFRCQQERDAIAALRDRTTALLATAAPRRVSPPPYAVLAARAQTRRQRSWQRSGMWAASIAGAVIAGWGLRTALDPHSATPPIPVAVNAAAAAPAESRIVGAPTPESGTAEPVFLAPTQPSTTQPNIRWNDPTVRLASGGSLSRRQEGRTAEAGTEDASLSLDDQWAPVSLEEAEDATGGLVPVVPDLPVLDIRMRRGDGESRPWLIVTQQHSSGAFIHIVEGPVTEVAEFVSDQIQPGTKVNSSEPGRSPPDYLEAAGQVQRTSRVLAVVARLPVDSLNVLAQGVVLK